MRALLLMALVGLPALSGCLECTPLLELRHCTETQCVPSADAVEVDWSDADAEAWPEVDAWLRGLPLGEHDHHDWTPEQEDAFWNHYGVEGGERELIVSLDDARYRIRVLTCD